MQPCSDICPRPPFSPVATHFSVSFTIGSDASIFFRARAPDRSLPSSLAASPRSTGPPSSVFRFSLSFNRFPFLREALCLLGFPARALPRAWPPATEPETVPRLLWLPDSLDGLSARELVSERKSELVPLGSAGTGGTPKTALRNRRRSSRPSKTSTTLVLRI